MKQPCTEIPLLYRAYLYRGEVSAPHRSCSIAVMAHFVLSSVIPQRP
jgi:hypothetical protein